MSFENEDLLRNIKRQAKRLAKILSCPLGHAQESLAICVYDCGSYGELIALLKSHTFQNPVLTLAALHPKSEVFVHKLLAENMAYILTRFSGQFEKLSINEEMVISLFGLSFSEFKLKIST